jgi:hypothetical protein
MVVPNKFIKWRDSTNLPIGSKIRGLLIYKNFIASCDGSFYKLPKGVFYSWVRDNVEGIKEGKDARGIWFIIGDQIDTESINSFDFINKTCSHFSDWFEKNYEGFMHNKLSTTELRTQFLNDACNGGDSIEKIDRNVYLTKQMFNKWLVLGANRFNRQFIIGRDSHGKWIIIM